MRPLTTSDLERAVTSCKQSNVQHCFLGVFPANDAPIGQMGAGELLIVNCCRADKPGRHWLAVYCVRQRREFKFFESTGRQPQLYSPELKLPRKTIWTYGAERLQPLGSHTCGYFCLYFLLCKANSALQARKFHQILQHLTHQSPRQSNRQVVQAVHNHFPTTPKYRQGSKGPA